MSHEPHHAHESQQSPADYWEDRYAGSDRVWSGKVNATTAAVVAELAAGRGAEPGEALELGCGEGGDAVWLAEQGWRVTAVDISPTAVARGATGAAERGVGERIAWVAHDLATWQPDHDYDLVTASFLHSTVELDRTAILRRAAAAIRPGGHLLLVSHVFESDEDVPPWAFRRADSDGPAHAHAHDTLLLPDQEVAALALDPEAWEVATTEIRRREATSPDGTQTATVKDGVTLLRRR